MLGSTDQIQVFAFDLVHHGIHLVKTHNAGNNVASDHVWRDAVCETAVDHKVTGISQNCGVQTGNVTFQIIKTVSGYFSCTVKVDTIKFFHDFCMIWDLEIRNNRLTKTLNFYVLAIIFSNRDRRINDVRNGHHDLFDLLLKLAFLCLKLCQTLCIFGNLLF